MTHLAPKRRPTQRAPDVWESARFTGIFLASGFSCSQALSTPAHTRVTQTVSPPVKWEYDMTKIIQTNWFAGLASIVPGLGIIILGKKRLGLGITLAVGLLLAIFLYLPNLITWFIFGIAFIAQMAYAVGLTTIQTTKIELTPNSNLSHQLPSKFNDNKTIALEVEKSLSTILGSDEQLTTAIIGLKKDTTQFMFVGVTEEHLILSPCSHAGNPSNPSRILKDDVSWVNLKNGERNLFLTIEYENGKKIDLHLLGKLREQVKLIVDEFPGTSSNENFMDEMLSLKKENNRLSANIIYIACFVFMIAVVFLTDGLEQTYKQLVFYLSFSFIFFIMGWPQFITFVRRLKKEPGITSINAIASLSMLSILFLWWISLYTMGIFSIAIVKYLQNAG